ncbi:MAG: histidine phosphatase family protein [Candidatus Melainabacteria bacterium]|nr:histidine phosphatase family protein [Candidatus Melainabacteria bacterium]
MDILDYKECVTKIYFVRHGETKANKLRLLFGQLDLDLNKQGLKDARRVASKLLKIAKKEKISFIISSPLKRAKHTANIISQELVRAGLAPASRIIIDKNLMEKSEGTWDGKSFWDVRQKDPKNYYSWVKDPFKNRTPKGESVLDLNKRVKKFYKTVLKKYLGKNIIVTTHSGPIRLFVLNLLGTKINKFWYLKTECGSITEVHISKKHAMIWSLNVN